MSEKPIKIAWAPQPWQIKVLQRSEFELLTGGARFAGKTEAQQAWFAEPQFIGHPAARGLMLRKNSTDLSDWLGRAKMFYRPVRGEVVGNPPEIRFPSGCVIRTGHMQEEKVYEKYQGHEYQKLGIEELTQIPTESCYENVLASCRSTIPGLTAQAHSTTNPGGPGHLWAKKRFVDRCRLKTYWYADGHKSRLFIPGTYQDNPIGVSRDPGYMHYIASLTDLKLRRAWLYGDWDVFSGQFFDTFDSALHIIKPFAISRDWAHFRGIDFGYTSPACCLWVTVDYDYNHYFYRELYESGNTSTQFAQKVQRRTPDGETIISTYADPSIWAKNQSGIGTNRDQQTIKSIADQFLDAGLYCMKANNDRMSGWNNMRDLMYWDANKKPKFYIFENCENLIRTLPAMIHDDKKVEDMAEGEDHAVDAARYVLMHTFQKAKREQPEDKMDRFIESITVDREWKQSSRKDPDFSELEMADVQDWDDN